MSLFTGTVEHYARYRPPYPPVLIQHVVGSAGHHGCLLDVACGPGRLTMSLSAHFDSVVAVDAEQEMIAVAKREARGVGVVEWVVGNIEEQRFAEHRFDLMTVGEAFHRVDQR